MMRSSGDSSNHLMRDFRRGAHLWLPPSRTSSILLLTQNDAEQTNLRIRKRTDGLGSHIAQLLIPT